MVNMEQVRLKYEMFAETTLIELNLARGRSILGLYNGFAYCLNTVTIVPAYLQFSI